MSTRRSLARSEHAHAHGTLSITAAVFFQLLIVSAPQSARLSMCTSSSSHVMTPGVESGGTKSGHCAHLGYAPTSLHIAVQMPASLFWNCVRCAKSSAAQPFSSAAPFTFRRLAAEAEASKEKSTRTDASRIILGASFNGLLWARGEYA